MADVVEIDPRARDYLAITLDNIQNNRILHSAIEEFSPYARVLKIAQGTFTKFGHEAPDRVYESNDTFLDLKTHDTPDQVYDAAWAAANLYAKIITVHTVGGPEMMEAAVKGVQSYVDEHGGVPPKILGVTYLTTMTQEHLNHHIGVPGTVEEFVLRMAHAAEDAGLDGVVCSGQELRAIRAEFPDEFYCAVTGIRGSKSEPGKNQKRVVTAAEAMQEGADLIIAGRTLTEQPTYELRQWVAYGILEDIEQHLPNP